MSRLDFSAPDLLVALAVTSPLLIAVFIQVRRRAGLRAAQDRECRALGDGATAVAIAMMEDRAPRMFNWHSPRYGVLFRNAAGFVLRIVGADGARRELRIDAGPVVWVGSAPLGATWHEWLALGRGGQQVWVAVERTSGSAELFRELTGASPPASSVEGSCYDGTLVYPPQETLSERLRRIAPVLVFGGILFVLGRADLAWLNGRAAAIPESDHFGAAYIASLMLGHLFLLVWGTALAAMSFSVRALRAGRFPWKDQQVVHPTRVIRGRCLALRFAMVPAVVIVGLLWSSAQAVRFVELIYTNALDRQVIALLRPNYAKPKPAASLAESLPSNSSAGQVHP